MTVTPDPEGKAWDLTDLLGRSMGCIEETAEGHVIRPDGQALETMAGIRPGPYASLDVALLEIEIHTRSVCRLVKEGPSSKA